VTRGSGGIMLIVAATAVGAAVVTGILMLGSPAVQREQRLDSVRVRDLAAIELLIASYAGLHKAQPRDLESLAREPGYSVRTNDPESGVPYDYETRGADSYRLCATFKTGSSEATSRNMYGQSLGATWAHGIGRQCFSRHTNLPPHLPVGP
jgi:hypothetical protein